MWDLSLRNVFLFQDVGTAAVEETKCGSVWVSPLGGLQLHSYCCLKEEKKFGFLFLSTAEEDREKQMDYSSCIYTMICGSTELYVCILETWQMHIWSLETVLNYNPAAQKISFQITEN